MRLFAAALLAVTATAAIAATDPRTVPTQLSPEWQAKTRDVFKQAIEIPSVHNRGEMPRMAKLLADQFRAAGIPEADIHVMPYEALPGDKTVALIVRWRSPHATKKPMLVLGHMDVVEAKREDWKFDPFVFREEDGYFLGRGTSDMKNGDVATTMAAVKLMSEGFKPDRDIIFFYSGDEETHGQGRDARRDQVAQPHRRRIRAQRRRRLRVLRPQVPAARLRHLDGREDLPDLFLHHPQSRRPQLAPAPGQCDLRPCRRARRSCGRTASSRCRTTSAAAISRSARRQEGDSPLGQQIRAWLANPNDGAAADAIEANPLEVGLTRTRCVATMLSGGHADNALPQSATATVNCRIFPGVQPKDVQAELQQLVGPKVEVTPDPNYIGDADARLRRFGPTCSTRSPRRSSNSTGRRCTSFR